jgi:hypothetical protein
MADTNETPINFDNMTVAELARFRYQVENQLRIKRIKCCLAVIAERAKTSGIPGRVQSLEELLARELNMSYPRAVFIDDFLDQIELLLDIDLDFVT